MTLYLEVVAFYGLFLVTPGHYSGHSRVLRDQAVLSANLKINHGNMYCVVNKLIGNTGSKYCRMFTESS